MDMKVFFNKFIFVFFLFTTLILKGENSPVPPEIKSDIGYISVEEDISIVPAFKRFMILPHVELLVLSEDTDAYILVYLNKSSSFSCKVPKYAKNMVLLRETKQDHFISFRGPIEVKTIPFNLKKGEELPVTNKNDGNYIVQVMRKGEKIPITVPVDNPGILFNTQSEFAKFAEKQKSKGLSFYKGEWLPEKEVELKMNKEISERNKKERFWKNIKGAASHGVVVLKNGAVLHGKLSGSNDYNILFESGSRDYFLGFDDLADLSSSVILARGKLDKAGTSLFNSKRNIKKAQGVAMYHAEEALKHLQGIKKETAEEYSQAELLIAEVSSIIEDIDKYLNESGKAIYQNAVFPVENLNYHLENGHVLLRKKIWLLPEQLCDECHSSGKITCSDCKGKGRIAKDCELCVTGRITCTECEGKGRKECDYCGGKGYVYTEKPRTTVIASFGTGFYRRRYRPRYHPGTQIYSKDGIIAITPSYPYYYPPCDRGSYFSIGREETVVKELCPKCRGTGTLRCPKTIKCTECKGVGYFIETCKTCNGSKQLSCSECAGKGYNGSPQLIPEKPEPVEEESKKESEESAEELKDKQEKEPTKDPQEGQSYINAPVVIP